MFAISYSLRNGGSENVDVKREDDK